MPYGHWLIPQGRNYLTAMDIDDLWGSNECHGLGNSREINLSFKAVGLAAIGIALNSYRKASNQLLVGEPSHDLFTQEDKSSAGSKNRLGGDKLFDRFQNPKVH